MIIDDNKKQLNKYVSLINLDFSIITWKLNKYQKMIDYLKSKKEKDNHIPVIVLTNLSSNDRAAMARGQGVYDYLIKTDWKLEDLVKKVKQKLYAEDK